MDIFLEQQKKYKKLLVIADWVFVANKTFNITSTAEVTRHIKDIVGGAIRNIDLVRTDWTINDGYWIAAESKIDLPLDALAVAVFEGLRQKVETNKEKGLIKCSRCRKPKPAIEFGSHGAHYCKSCRKKYRTAYYHSKWR